MSEENITKSNRIKGIIIIIVLFVILVLPVCYALYKEHNVKQMESNNHNPAK